MGVAGDHGPVAVVVSSGLGEAKLEGLVINLVALDPGVQFDGDTILVPGKKSE
jgi:hypothetical protein